MEYDANIGDQRVADVQLLDPAGQQRFDTRYDQYLAGVDDTTLRRMYRDMVLVRRFDAEATALQRQGELALWVQSLGQEAAQVGSAWALEDRDYAFPSYREHGVVHVRGIDLTQLLRLFRGIEHGGWDFNEYRTQPYTLVVGAQPLHATGYAQGLQHDGLVGTGDPATDTAVITYFGDGASSEGDVNEALIYAAASNAPVVFFCQNNQWAISAPQSVQSKAPLYLRGSGFGMPCVRVDGNDVMACYAVTKAAMERARSGGGPTFIEAYTYRLGAHTTADDPTRYRDAEEEAAWRAKDPIDRLRQFLVAQSMADDAFFAALDAEADEFAERIRTGCRALPDPDPAEMFEHVYAEPHSLVDEERAWYNDYRAAMAASEGTPASDSAPASEGREAR